MTHAPIASAALAALALTGALAPTPGADDSPVELTLRSRAAGDGRTAYAISVRNTSEKDVPHGLVTQLLPQDQRHAGTTPQARSVGQQVTWRVELPAGSRRVLTLTAEPGRGAHATDGKGDGRGTAASTTVCFQRDARGQWLTCTGPEGGWTPEPWVSANKVYSVGSAAAALLVGTAGIVVLRRRRARQVPAPG